MPPLLAELNMHKRIHIHYNPELEADDVIFTLNALLPGKKVIVTSDNDMLQCLGCDTIIDMGKQVVDIASYPKQFEEKFHNVQISKLPMYRAIVGDSSDNIRAAIPRFPHKLAARFVSFLDMNLDTFPSHDALEEARKQFIQKEKVSASENAWIERLLSLEIPKKKEKKKNESKNEETQINRETDEDVMSLLPEELRPMRLVDITTSNNANAKKAPGKMETDEDDDILKSNFSRWQDNFALMKLHAYTIDEISMEPKMEFDAMPSEIDNLFMKMRKAHSLFPSLT
jgi:5'-3' exonuclease